MVRDRVRVRVTLAKYYKLIIIISCIAKHVAKYKFSLQ